MTRNRFGKAVVSAAFVLGLAVAAQPSWGAEDEPSHFPAGAISPILGASVAGFKGDVQGGVTAGLGYFVVERLELSLALSLYFGSATIMGIDPSVMWVFYEASWVAPYLRITGGPLIPFGGNEKLAWRGFGGGGLYFFAGRVFGLKAGFLPGFMYFTENKETIFAWMIDAGIVIGF